ncbi:Gfo/Idh/MocA family protein [Ereboglobus luteus]|uniref:Oxidoreductase n=1 Tax=Ereboglobus luteus TaxID=1796921 RepID=A0A2U8E067_9BACT|nr:Gfo/Idh/MocA family oxidoreductase [Ereboglobus luteus]AWI08226.1 oxidoreductase [Ereboglobus luteus]
MTQLTRRKFLGTAAAISAVPLLTKLPAAAFAAGSDRIKVGVIGTGGRGVGAMRNCLAADPSVVVWALGDVFKDRVDEAREKLIKGSPKSRKPSAPVPSDRFFATPERCFSGFDAYKQVIASGVDLVILAAPPGFRPLHLEAAVNAGKHVFAEKPVAVDPAGVRKVISVGELAKQKRLAIVAGTQRRHAANYLETMRRIHDGAIGELVGGQCYWLQEGLWHRGRNPEWTEMEYQLRNWLYFTWLSGDHIVEQHVHNIDVMNWAFGGPPVKALGMGGRQARTDPKYGDAYDHFSVEFEYANGVRVQSLCRQTPNAQRRVNERVVGTKGYAMADGKIFGANKWKYDGDTPDAFKDEHVDLIRSIRDGNPLNEAKRIAESTLTAILGRTSAYTGKEINYNWILNASKQDLTPSRYELGAAPEVVIPIPGVTPLV